MTDESEKENFSKLKKILIDSRIPEKKINKDSRFKEDFGMGSLDRLEFCYTVEEKWGISIPDDDVMSELNTVRDYIECIPKKVEKYKNP